MRAAAAAALGDLSLAALEAPYKLGKKEAGKEAPKAPASSGGIKLGGSNPPSLPLPEPQPQPQPQPQPLPQPQSQP